MSCYCINSFDFALEKLHLVWASIHPNTALMWPSGYQLSKDCTHWCEHHLTLSYPNTANADVNIGSSAIQILHTLMWTSNHQPQILHTLMWTYDHQLYPNTTNIDVNIRLQTHRYSKHWCEHQTSNTQIQQTLMWTSYPHPSTYCIYWWDHPSTIQYCKLMWASNHQLSKYCKHWCKHLSISYPNTANINVNVRPSVIPFPVYIGCEHAIQILQPLM